MSLSFSAASSAMSAGSHQLLVTLSNSATSPGNGSADATDSVGSRNNRLAVISCCFPAALEDRVYLK